MASLSPQPFELDPLATQTMMALGSLRTSFSWLLGRGRKTQLEKSWLS